MRKITHALLVLAAAAATISCNDEENGRPSTPPEDCLTKNTGISGQAIEDSYIVSVVPADPGRRVASVVNVTDILETNQIPKEKIASSFEGVNSYHLMSLTPSEAAALKADGRVSSVEPDRIISICGCFEVVEPTSVRWNVGKVGYGDGTGKTAWIIDTGIESDHPDLNVDTRRSRSFLAGESSFEDDNGHGTHIAGIVGGLNNSIGVLGVASGASLVAIKVLDENGDGKLSALLNALSYIKAQAKPGDVVNISIGFPEISEILENEIRSIARSGVYFTLAAGNESAEAGEYSPARTEGQNIYTITAVDSLNRFAAFSNFGNDVVDYAAPGVRVLSTFTGGGYAYLSGTSMAAPHVAGLLLINNGKINTAGYALDDPDGVADPLAHR